MTVNTGALQPPHNKSKEEQLLYHDFHFFPKKSKRFTAVNKSNSRVAVGSDGVRGSGAFDGIEECFGGKSLIFFPLEGLEKQGGQEMTGENREDVFHKVNMITNLGNGNNECFIGGSNRYNLFDRESRRGYFTVPTRVQLINILEGLASLDEYGIFLDSVEDSFAPEYSKTIKRPTSFSMMRGKVQSEGYTSWRSFVEDFECLCYNVMEYNQKCPQIWNAANSMLHQGTAYLDQWAEKADKIFGCSSKIEAQNGPQCFESSDNVYGSVGNVVIPKMKHNSKCVVEFTDSAIPAKSCSQPDVKNVIPPVETDGAHFLPTNERPQNVFFSTSACIESLGYIEEQEENRLQTDIKVDNLSGPQVGANDSVVNIIECSADDIRFDFPEQATESSSSFGGTDIDYDNDSGCKETHDAAEVGSQLHSMNRASAAVEDFGAGTTKRKKHALSREWKAYRRGIEWRCRWLELQINELQSRASKYDDVLDRIQAKKLEKDEQHLIKASTARAVPLIYHSQRQHILHRKPRKKVENMGNLVAYMSQHPLFSLYEKKKRMEADGSPVDDDLNNMPRGQIWRCSAGELKGSRSDESDFSDHLAGAETTENENSVELMLWKIENLQSRIFKMKSQLNKHVLRKTGRISSKTASQSLLSVEYPKGIVQSSVYSPSGQVRSQTPVGGGWKLQSGSSHSRRRVSDFNINNVIMLGNSVSTYVEPARHDFIETPRWRLVNRHMPLDQSGREDSSEEVTDDEVYTERHRRMEVKEKYRRDFPRPCKKLPGSDGLFGKGAPKMGLVQTVGATEKNSTSAPEDILRSSFLPLDLSIPKRKRKGKKCRPSS